MSDDPNNFDAREAAMRADEDFMRWLQSYFDGWESEYIGAILGMHDAFNAGRAAQRLDDHVNSDHE